MNKSTNFTTVTQRNLHTIDPEFTTCKLVSLILFIFLFFTINNTYALSSSNTANARVSSNTTYTLSSSNTAHTRVSSNTTYTLSSLYSNIDSTKLSNEILITGNVTNTEDEALPGVVVATKDRKITTVTDKYGDFSIRISTSEGYLYFSFIGMKTKKLKISSQKYLKVIMEVDNIDLDEVVVNGFNPVKLSSYTGSITKITHNQIIKTNSKSIIAAIQVFEPSFRITPNNIWGSDPNSLPEFKLRGESSIGNSKGIDEELLKRQQRTSLNNNPNLPVFILDGFEVDVDKIYDMDINRIESVTLLKDAAATALYGSRAANGVLVFQTITPNPGKLSVNYSGTYSLELPDLSDYNLCNASEKLEVEKYAGIYKADNAFTQTSLTLEYNEKLQNILRGYDTDWMAQPLKNAFNHKHSIYLEGGNDIIRYGLDFGYDVNNGVMKSSYRNRKEISFMFMYNFKNIRIRNTISYNNVSSLNSPYGNFSTYAKMQPYYRIYDDEGEMIETYGYNDFNPLYNTKLYSYDGDASNDNFTENLQLDYHINSIFRIKAQLSVQKGNNKTESFRDPDDRYYDSYADDLKGELYRQYSNSTKFSYKTLLILNKVHKAHSINAVLGIDLSQSKSSSNSTSYQGFQIGNLHSPQFAAQQKDKTAYSEDDSRLVGYLASLNYTFKEIYLLDASFRYDGSSKFGANTRFAPFWSLGTGINLHLLDLIKDIPFITKLKLRLSYGSLGKINFASYSAITSYAFNEEYWTKTGVASFLTSLGNPDLKWETTKVLDGGIDLLLFKGKLNFKADYYNKKTVDMITDLYLRRSSGFEKYKINSGEITNKGYEISMDATIFQNSDALIRIYANIASNKNKITGLSEAMQKYNDEINRVFKETNYYSSSAYKELAGSPIQKYYVGASTTAIYAVKSAGIDPSNGKERYYRKNGTSTYTWNADDQVIVGDTSPDAQGSFGINLSYKGFYLSTSFLYQYGAQIYNETLKNKVEDVDIKNQNVDKRVLSERWKNPGDNVSFLDIAENSYTKPTSRFVQDNDYISFNSLSLGYDFKTELIQKWGLNNVGISLNLVDIARWSVVRMERGTNYPYARNFSLTLKMSF